MSNYLRRLLLFSLVLGALPVITIGLISYYISSKDIEEKVRESNMQILLQTQMRVEQVLKTLELSAFQFVNSPIINTTANMQLSIDNFDEIKDLVKGLEHLQTLSGISEASLIHFQRNWYLDYRKFRTFNEDPQKERFLAYAKQPNSLFWVAGPAASTDITAEGESTKSRGIVSMVLKIPAVPLTTTPRQMLVVDIRAAQIQNLLTVSDKLHRNYILDRSGHDLLSDADQAAYKDINALITQKVKEGEQTEGFFTTGHMGSQLGVTFRASPYNSWTYVSITSMKDLTKQSRKIALITLIICIVIFLLVALIAFYGSRRMYSPIRKLFEFTKGMDGTGGGDKPGDEFIFIEERLRALSTTGKELEYQLRGQYAQLREYFVLKIMNGQIQDKDYAERAGMYGLPTDWHKLAILTLQIDTLQDTRYRDHDKELLLFAINNMVSELLPESTRLNPILIEQSQVTLLTLDEQNETELKVRLHETAEKIKTKVDEYLQLKVSVGISKPYERISGTLHAYVESLQALKSRLNLGNDIIVHYEDIEGRKEDGAANHYHLKLLEDQIVSSLKMADLARAQQIFDDYVGSIVERGVGYSEYSTIMMQLISKVYQIVQERGKSVSKELGEESDIEHFMKRNTITDIKKWFTVHLFEPIVRFLNEQAETQYLDIANQMVKIIHERYEEELSLESCASQLNFHPVYLSRVFKKEIGINFSEYLVEYRMNMAKTWLENTNMKISDIAEKLQYTNTSAFIRTFRKIVGMTPGQYRDQFSKN